MSLSNAGRVSWRPPPFASKKLANTRIFGGSEVLNRILRESLIVQTDSICIDYLIEDLMAWAVVQCLTTCNSRLKSHQTKPRSHQKAVHNSKDPAMSDGQLRYHTYASLVLHPIQSGKCFISMMPMWIPLEYCKLNLYLSLA
jgi:hypothetical protein